jgi:hypothetical protein
MKREAMDAEIHPGNKDFLIVVPCLTWNVIVTLPGTVTEARTDGRTVRT